MSSHLLILGMIRHAKDCADIVAMTDCTCGGRMTGYHSSHCARVMEGRVTGASHAIFDQRPNLTPERRLHLEAVRSGLWDAIT